MVEATGWAGVGVVELHWGVCTMCGTLHHSLMVHIMDAEGILEAISPTEYERMRFE
jgi:hypothetical protein